MRTLALAALLLARCGAAPPHFITILADDLGWADTALYNPLAPTPRIKEEADQGLLLERHYVFRYCSPSRRAFLSGRFPTSITTVQPDGADACSDFLPLATTTLAEKLSRGAGYECHFIGKGHLGYETTDHLPIRRGFASHLGFLLGSESYYHGGGAANASEGAHDLWEDAAPACAAVVAGMNYSTDVYVGRALEKIGAAAAAPPGARAPLFVYLALQNVHDPYNEPPPGERGGPWPDFPLCADCTYAHMLHALDAAVGNVTAALRRGALWDETLLLFSADNGPIGGSGSSRPLRGRKHDPWEGGTRAAAFLAGGALPAALRGARSGAKLVHVADWYPTFLGLAGVDSADDALIGGAPRPIDGVDVWPLLTGANATPPRALTPVTEASIIDVTGARARGGADGGETAAWWKLVTLGGQSVRFTENATAYSDDADGPCLAARQPDPPQPGRTDPLVSGCATCNASAPCLYDVLADPNETVNVAAAHPDVVARLAAALAAASTYYVSGRIPADALAANYTPINTTEEWGGFQGPCYRPKSPTRPGSG